MPPNIGKILENEGREMRKMLGQLGIPTPGLISISCDELVEEYIEGGDLYRTLASGHAPSLASTAGMITGRLHRSGYVFTDNKVQNYLVRENHLLRTDLGFIQKSSSVYARSMDIGSFLASVIDLREYLRIENAFFEGYRQEAGHTFPYLSMVIRNILTAGFASNTQIALKNMVTDTSKLIGA